MPVAMPVGPAPTGTAETFNLAEADVEEPRVAVPPPPRSPERGSLARQSPTWRMTVSTTPVRGATPAAAPPLPVQQEASSSSGGPVPMLEDQPVKRALEYGDEAPAKAARSGLASSTSRNLIPPFWGANIQAATVDEDYEDLEKYEIDLDDGFRQQD